MSASGYKSAFDEPNGDWCELRLERPAGQTIYDAVHRLLLVGPAPIRLQIDANMNGAE
jgi:hypothetical protein